MLIHFVVPFNNPDKSVNLKLHNFSRVVCKLPVWKMNIHIPYSPCFLCAVASLSDISKNVTQLLVS